MAVSMFELCSLELQRFGTLLKLHPIELRAIFWGSGHRGTCWWRSWIPQTMCGVETGVAFAGEKWMYFVRFSVAEVLLVSMVAVEGHAVVMAVSWWPASVAAKVSLVSMSPRCCVLSAKKFALRHRVAVKARNSSPCKPKMAEKR